VFLGQDLDTTRWNLGDKAPFWNTLSRSPRASRAASKISGLLELLPSADSQDSVIESTIQRD